MMLMVILGHVGHGRDCDLVALFPLAAVQGGRWCKCDAIGMQKP